MDEQLVELARELCCTIIACDAVTSKHYGAWNIELVELRELDWSRILQQAKELERAVNAVERAELRRQHGNAGRNPRGAAASR